jgi:hypothetical protein
MSLRTFRAQDGSRWSVWETRARAASRYHEGPIRCLAFVDETGIERARLFNVPPQWEEVSAARLEVLLEYAERLPLAPYEASVPVERGDWEVRRVG